MDSFERYVLLPLGATLVAGLLVVGISLVGLAMAGLAMRLFV